MASIYRCSRCMLGKVRPGFVDHFDLSALFGVDARLVHAAALVCGRCGAVTLEGPVVEAAERALGRLIVANAGPLEPKEVSFLRGLLGLTQAELGERLGVHRASVACWEAAAAPVGVLESLAIRTMAVGHLGDAEPAR